jgi:hypothetical protein
VGRCPTPYPVPFFCFAKKTESLRDFKVASNFETILKKAGAKTFNCGYAAGKRGGLAEAESPRFLRRI